MRKGEFQNFTEKSFVVPELELFSLAAGISLNTKNEKIQILASFFSQKQRAAKLLFTISHKRPEQEQI